MLEGEGIQTSMTATPTQMPRMMPTFSCSQACTFFMQPYKGKTRPRHPTTQPHPTMHNGRDAPP